MFYPFSQPDDGDYSDYRPVLSADAASMIFERTFSADPGQTKLYIADLATNDLKPLVNIASLRPDWCWNRANDGSLKRGTGSLQQR